MGPENGVLRLRLPMVSLAQALSFSHGRSNRDPFRGAIALTKHWRRKIGDFVMNTTWLAVATEVKGIEAIVTA